MAKIKPEFDRRNVKVIDCRSIRPAIMRDGEGHRGDAGHAPKLTRLSAMLTSSVEAVRDASAEVAGDAKKTHAGR